MKFPIAEPPLPRRGNWLTRTLARGIFSLAGWRVEGELPSVPKFVAIVAPHGIVGECVAAFSQMPTLVLGLAPEGTRKGESKWKTGFYQIAVGADVPILPMAFDYGAHVVRLLPLFNPGCNLDHDIATLSGFFRDVHGKRPRVASAAY